MTVTIRWEASSAKQFSESTSELPHPSPISTNRPKSRISRLEGFDRVLFDFVQTDLGRTGTPYAGIKETQDRVRTSTCLASRLLSLPVAHRHCCATKQLGEPFALGSRATQIHLMSSRGRGQERRESLVGERCLLSRRSVTCSDGNDDRPGHDRTEFGVRHQSGTWDRVPSKLCGSGTWSCQSVREGRRVRMAHLDRGKGGNSMEAKNFGHRKRAFDDRRQRGSPRFAALRAQRHGSCCSSHARLML